jgi:hypothetical protein
MEADIEEYQADLSSVSGFSDLTWSIARFNRMASFERIEPRTHHLPELPGKSCPILRIHGRP